MTEATKPSPQVPRWIVRTIWIGHRAAFRLTGGRFGLRTAEDTRWGMLRLRSTGRGGTLEPLKPGRGFEIRSNWPGLALIALGAVLLLAGAAT